MHEIMVKRLVSDVVVPADIADGINASINVGINVSINVIF